MNYKQISFEVSGNVTVDWGDGSLQSYPAGIVTGTPKGEVVVTSTEPIEEIKFLSDTIAKATFDDAPDLKYLDEAFKGKKNIQVVYFDKNSPLRTTRETFQDSGIIYFSDLFYNTPEYMQYTALRADRLECVAGMNTTNARNAYGLFENAYSLNFPKKSTIDLLEATDQGGSEWDNTTQCIHPIYNSDVVEPHQGNYTVVEGTLEPEWDVQIPCTNDYNPVPRTEYAYLHGSATYDGTNKAITFGSSGRLVVMMSNRERKAAGAMWVKLIDDGRTTHTFISAGSTSPYVFQMVTSTMKLEYYVDTNTSRLTSNTQLQFGVWTHIAYSYNTKEAKLYINGVLDSTKQNSILASESLFFPTATWVMFGGNTSHISMNGFMSNMKYGDYKTDEEILAIYNKEKDAYI